MNLRLIDAPAEEPRPPTNVVAFKPEFWEHECGSARFVLRRGGIVECAWCGKAVAGKVWGDTQ